MIERTFDAAFFNRICNLPEVRPFMAPGAEPLDVSAVVTNPANYALRTEHGGFILIACGAGFYSVHTQFAAEGRGAHALKAMREGFDFMFTRTDCMRIFSHCPDSNPAALAFAQAGGARPWFRREHEPNLGPAQMVSWDIMDWLVGTPELEADGKRFHELLEDAKAGGSELPQHEDDAVHNRVVGGAIRMCQRGQAGKGVLFYNLWAMAAAYEPIKLLSADPPRVDVRDAVIGLDETGELEVIKCR